MAKAEATCICEYCGKSFKKTTVKNNRREADNWEIWAMKTFTVCPDCEEKAKADKAKELAAEAKEDGLPDLIGSEKQIIWAEEIRRNLITKINKEIEISYATHLKSVKTKEELAQIEETKTRLEITANFIFMKKYAGWWIDHRDTGIITLIGQNMKEALEQSTKQVESEQVPEEPIEEEELDPSIIIPENATEGIVEIVFTKEAVMAYYPKDDKFREVMKSELFTWNPELKCWNRYMTERTGCALDRAADISNTLMQSGFSIKCENEEVREKAIKGNFIPECHRWISLYTSGKNVGWIAIHIPPKRVEPNNQPLYDAARKINGSKFDRGYVAVPIAQYSQVEDFAEIYNYKFTKNAKETIEKYKKTTTVKPAKPEPEKTKEPLKEILKSDDAILTDLVDE